MSQQDAAPRHVSQHPRFLDLTGQIFGMLTVLRYAGWREQKTYWLCRCVCGVEKEVWSGRLTGNRTRSCGKCIRIKAPRTERTCSGCKQNFPATGEFFPLDKSKESPGNPNGCGSRCLECARAYKRGWDEKNAERKKATHKKWQKTYRKRKNRKSILEKRLLKWEVLKAYGGDEPACACCGESAFEFLTIDHINNDGSQHRKTMAGTNLYLVLKKEGYPPGFQVLCMNCNFSKGKYGYCPHKAPTVDIEACRREYYTRKPRRTVPTSQLGKSG